MSEPVVFISHFKVKEGKLDELKRLAGKVERSLREDKPRTVAWLVFLDEGGTQVSFVHCFPDADSMDLHFEGSDERSAARVRVRGTRRVRDLREAQRAGPPNDARGRYRVGRIAASAAGIPGRLPAHRVCLREPD